MTTATGTTQPTSDQPGSLDVERIRRDFPLLARRVDGRPLVYLDSAATTQKPAAVIEAVSAHYREHNSNVHRGVHRLTQEATEAYEGTRDKIRRTVNAAESRELIFVRGTTEAINLIANSYARPRLKAGDEVLITHMEHHSNIVPWQMVTEATGAGLRVVPVNDAGELIMEDFEKLLTERTKIVSVVHISNALGTINPIREIVELAHRAGAVVVVDGAQGMQHQRVDVRGLGCDFYAFSGHKMFGPTGIGVLWGRAELLDAMPPYQGGGDMIKSVTFERTIYNDLPHKFEAGTPNVAGVVGLGAAFDYLAGIDMVALAEHEQRLLARATERLSELPDVRLVGTARHKAATVSFLMDDIHPHDIGTVLDHEGICIRTGHHCTQPLMARFGVAATARASLTLYNTLEEVDALADGLESVRKMFA